MLKKYIYLRKASLEFGVHRNTIQKVRKLKNEKGLLEMPDRVKRNKLSETVINLVMAYYCNDNNSRLLPGQKDYVSIGYKVHMPKRLLHAV